MEYINKNGFNGSLFDEFIVRSMADIEGLGAAFFQNLTEMLVNDLLILPKKKSNYFILQAKDPSQVNKFSAEAFEEIGDIATCKLRSKIVQRSACSLL
jgi:hypothetical protein